VIPAWLLQLGASAALLAATFSAGWLAHARKVDRAALVSKIEQSENARETERLAAARMTRISDALTQDRLRSDRAADAAAERLRQLADASPDPPAGCPSRNDDARPAAGILRDEDRDDLVALAREADAVSDRHRACQSVATPG
jgi:hypothetical protein